MNTTAGTWRRRASALFAGLAFFVAGAAMEARAAITTIAPGNLAGADVRPYLGPANPILHFTGGDGNPGNAEVAAALGYSGPSFCSRLDSPPGPSGTVTVGGIVFHYFYDPAGQNIYFSFDANAPVLWVVAKGGPEAYAFTYLPSGVLSDRALRSPGNKDDSPQGLSHFDFCTAEDEPIPPDPTIAKTVDTVWHRYFDWDLLKWIVVNGQNVEQQNHVLFYGDGTVSNYLIEATPTPYGLFTVSGTISISAQPGTATVVPGSVVDTLIFGADASNTEFHPTVSNCQAVDPGGTFGVIQTCQYTITLDSQQYAFLTGGGAGVNAAAAAVNFQGGQQIITTAPDSNVAFNFTVNPATTTGATLSVEDTLFAGDNAPPADHVFDAANPTDWTYQLPFSCPDDEGPNPNTATGTWDLPGGGTGSVSDSALVNVTCNVPPPVVEKTAVGSWIRYYTWLLDKSVTPASITMEFGDPAQNGNYTVTVSPTTYGKFTVTGTIRVFGSLGVVYTDVNVTDALKFDDAADGETSYPVTVSCGAITQPVVGNLQIRECTYARTFDGRQAAFAFLNGGDAGINRADATVTAFGKNASGFDTATFGFNAQPNDEVGEQLAVGDILDADNGTLLQHNFPDGDGNPLQWTYTRSYQCGDDEGNHHNIATGTWEFPDETGPGADGIGQVSDFADILIVCNVPPARVTKSAAGAWDRYFDWSLQKAATPSPITMYDGDRHDVAYTVTATATAKSKNFVVSGAIDVFGRAGVVYTSVQVSDDLTVDGVLYPNIPLVCTDDTNIGVNNLVEHCTYTFNVPASQANLVPGDGGSNLARVTVFIGQDSATSNSGPVPFTFASGAPANTFGTTLNATDTMQGAHQFTLQSLVWQYTRTYACGQSTIYTNTVQGSYDVGGGTGTTNQATASVDVRCRTVTVNKTALTRYARDYSWIPDKKIVVRPDDLTEQDKATYCPTLLADGPYAGSYLCDDIVIKLQPDGIYDTVYSLNAQQGSTESGFVINGTITVSWPADAPDPVFNPAQPSDVLKYLTAPTLVNATVGSCVVGDNAMTCPYQVAVNDKRAGINEASIVRPWICYAANNSVQACNPTGASTYKGSAPFNFDNAVVTETDKCVLMSDLFNAPAVPALNLGPSFQWQIGEICESSTVYVTGDINPDPGIFNILDIHAAWAPSVEQCRFVVPNLLRLAFDNGLPVVDEAVITVDACNFGCTFTQGYWKTHAIYAPKPQFAKKRDATWDLVGAQAENTTFFLSGTSWINVFHTAPKGNAYYNLAHQYMGAKLNGYGGASVPPSVATAIANAEAWFALYPPSHTFWSTKTTRQQVLQAAGVLGSYNEGAIGPGHCSEAPVRIMTMIK